MKFKGIILAIACLVLLSSFVSATFVLRNIYAISGSTEDVLEDGENIYVRPGTSLQIKVSFENDFTDEEDLDIDVDVEGLIDDIDDGTTLKRTDSISLDPDSSGSITLTFDIPYALPDNNYDLELDIDAEDDDGTTYNYDYDFPIDILKPEHELQIDNLKLSKDTVDCESEIGVSFEIINTGDKDEDDLKYIIENSDLDMYFKVTNMNLDEGRTLSVSKTVTFDPNVADDDYTINVYAYCDSDETSVKKSVTLEKKDCDPAQDDTSDDDQQQDTQDDTQQTDSDTDTSNQPDDSTQDTQSQQGTLPRVIIIPESEPKEEKPLLPFALLTTLTITIVALISYFLISIPNKKK